MHDHHDFAETFKLFMDAIAAGIGLVSWLSLEIIPVLLQWLSVIWVLLRIYETNTVQRALGRAPKERE